jgi:outer membrane protein assembly factor BamD
MRNARTGGCPPAGLARGARARASRLGAVAAVVALFVLSCGRAYIGPPTDTPQGRFEYARHLLETGRYYDAITELQGFISDNPGSGLLDTAIFYLGDAYLGKHDYPMAAAQFERLLREYPGSGNAPAARYKLGVAYFEQSPAAELDPTMTERALAQLRLFLKLHPDNPNCEDAEAKIDVLREKLAKKQYLNGWLYTRLKDPAAARFYFDIVLQEYPDTPWAPKSIIGTAKSYEIEKDTESAVQQYEKLLRAYPQSEEAPRARERLRELGADVEGGETDVADDKGDGSSPDEKP